MIGSKKKSVTLIIENAPYVEKPSKIMEDDTQFTTSTVIKSKDAMANGGAWCRSVVLAMGKYILIIVC